LIIAESDVVELKIKRGTEVLEKTIEKNEIRIPTVAVSEFEDLIESAEDNDNSELKYVIISEFGNETDNEFGEALEELTEQGVKRIVLDLRRNPGGYADAVIKICNRIVPVGPIIYTIDKDGTKREIKSDLKEKPFEKVVVLTDFSTASASEVLASALQDSKAAIVVGETTFGKGVIQSLYPMPIGGALKFTTEEYLRRSGKKLDRIGVKPDVEIVMPDLIIDPVILDDNKCSEVLPQVRSILTYLGYKLNQVDDESKFDNNLKKAVKRFQKDTGIEVNGELNTNTLIQLNLSLYLVYNETDKPLEMAYQILRQ
jgi:carboxyl-terminal processing protease